MAIYVANQILEGKIDYKKFFSYNLYKKYQTEVDAILTASGRADLIVPV